MTGERSVPEILGVPADEWQRQYYDEDVLGRCLGRVQRGIQQHHPGHRVLRRWELAPKFGTA